VIGDLPVDWAEALAGRFDASRLGSIRELVELDRARPGVTVYPRDDQVLAAFELTRFAQVQAVILGQDPYYQPDLACGLAFSVPATLPPERPLPLALKRIVAEAAPEQQNDLPAYPTLERWATHGVLLLNTVLTVRAGKPLSHRPYGWQQLTSAVVDALAAQPRPIVFLLWGEQAKLKGKLIDQSRHIVITSAHPSARIAHSHPDSFVGSLPFTCANSRLKAKGETLIDWTLE
jgi:uracil-DNA glycosylase